MLNFSKWYEPENPALNSSVTDIVAQTGAVQYSDDINKLMSSLGLDIVYASTNIAPLQIERLRNRLFRSKQLIGYINLRYVDSLDAMTCDKCEMWNGHECLRLIDTEVVVSESEAWMRVCNDFRRSKNDKDS